MEEHQNKGSKFWHELKRRKVVGVIVAYATIAIGIMYFAQFLENTFELPNWFDKLITVILLIGFPIAIIFSWIFDVSSKGITKTEPGKAPTAVTEKPVPEKSIIVLPFENISSDPEQEYFSDGLTEEIITDLSYINDLLVISRSSAMTFKGSKNTIQEIAAKVNVKYVLEGSVRKSGNNLRIVAQLIDAGSDSHIWAEKYNGMLDDIFDIQEKVSKSIAETLKIRLTRNEATFIETASFKNSNAYELFQKAKYEFYFFNEERLKRALLYLDKASEIEGENHHLLFMKGMIYANLFNIAETINNEYLNKAKSFMHKGFKSKPNSTLGYSLQGLIYFYDGNLKDAVGYLQKSYNNNPHDSFVIFLLILGYFYTGQNQKVKKVGQELMEADPFNPVNLILQALIHYMENNKAEALITAEKAYNNFSEVPQVKLYYAYYLLVNKKNDDALKIFEELVDKNAKSIFETMGKLFVCAIKKEEPDGILSSVILDKLKLDTEWLWLVADSYAIMDKKEKALELLENIVERGFINFPLLSEYDGFLNSLHDEKRFKNLMKRVKKEWENFEV